MATKPIGQGMKTKDFIASARKEGFTLVTERVGNDRTRIHISHPLLKDALDARSPTTKDVNGHLVKWVKKARRALEELAKDTAAPPPPPQEPVHDYAVPSSPEAGTLRKEGEMMNEARRAQEAADTLATWLDYQVESGIRQFPLGALNNKTRKKYSLPDPELISAALGLLVQKNILGTGTYTKEKNGRSYKAYRVNPALLSNGTTVIEAYTGEGWKALPPAPAYDHKLADKVKTPPKKPKSIPQPKPVAAAAGPTGFSDVLLRTAAQQESLVDQLVDMFIQNEQYDQLAQIVIEAKDVVACEKILRRVAEIAPRSE